MPWYVWAFDGFGGAVGVAVVGFLLRRFILKKQAKPPSISANLNSVSESNVAIGTNVTQQIVQHHHHVPDPPSDALRSTEPSPSQIISDLKALPPFERHQAQDKYQGLSVLWPLILLDVQRYHGIWNVMFRSFEERIHPPIVRLTFTELPSEIRISPTDTLFWVRGKVLEVELFITISLEADPEIVEVKRP